MQRISSERRSRSQINVSTKQNRKGNCPRHRNSQFAYTSIISTIFVCPSSLSSSQLDHPSHPQLCINHLKHYRCTHAAPDRTTQCSHQKKAESLGDHYDGPLPFDTLSAARREVKLCRDEIKTKYQQYPTSCDDCTAAEVRRDRKLRTSPASPGSIEVGDAEWEEAREEEKLRGMKYKTVEKVRKEKTAGAKRVREEEVGARKKAKDER